jgi:hypothetical protein
MGEVALQLAAAEQRIRERREAEYGEITAEASEENFQ